MDFENGNVLQQLRCGGVLEAVRISCAGFPTKMPYEVDFLFLLWLLFCRLIFVLLLLVLLLLSLSFRWDLRSLLCYGSFHAPPPKPLLSAVLEAQLSLAFCWGVT